jgi:hypothetical protein
MNRVLYKHISSAALQAAEIPYRQVNMTKGASFASKTYKNRLL